MFPYFAQHFSAHIFISEFAATENNGKLDLVGSLEKLYRVTLLELKIVLSDLRSQLDFFDLDCVLLLLGLALAFVRFVLEFSVVYDAADGRSRRRRHLHEIESPFLRQGKCLFDQHYAQLFAFIINDSNFGYANHPVYPGARLALSPFVD